MPTPPSAELQRGQLQLAALQKPAAEAIAAETKAIALFAIEALLTGLTKKLAITTSMRSSAPEAIVPAITTV